MELEIFEALTAANVPAEKARAAVASIKKEINDHYALHATQLATRGDVEGVRKEVAMVKTDIAEMETRLLRAMNDMQRWTIAATFAALAAMAALSKFLN